MAKQARESEHVIQHQIRQALSDDASVRMFRFQSGRFWQGEVIERNPTFVVLRHPRVVNVGFDGLADLDGWVSRLVTPEMIGTQIAQFAAIEVKKMRQKPTSAQDAFLDRVRIMGGLAGTAHSADEARSILLLR